jgi:FkbM family methyltransferase
MGTMERVVRHVRKRYRAFRTPQRGNNIFADLATVIRPALVFDVGANVGQSAAKFRRHFPGAQIHCFEPSASSAQRIRARGIGNVAVHNFALGSIAGMAMLSQDNDSAVSRLSEDGGEAVTVETADAFCAAHGINRIDFMKIDTEGHDLHVLQGAAAMLRACRIAAIQVEAGLNPENTLHVPFETLKAFLEAYDYRLFGIYDQVREWPTKQPHLRRANPLFVSREIYAGAR